MRDFFLRSVRASILAEPNKTKDKAHTGSQSPWRGEEGHPPPASGFGAGRGEELQPLAAPLFL